jgi:protein-S-isoprenylcysteine O-methyltransferase Ste14
VTFPAWVHLAAILAPLAIREAVHWRSAPRRPSVPAAERHGGAVSATCWNVVFLALLAIAVVAAVEGDLWHGGSLGLPWLWAGSLLRVWSYRALGDHYSVTIVVRRDHELVRSGPYRWLRHPLHLGLNVEMLGLVLMRPQLLTFGLLAIALLVLFARNRVEERALVHAFGDDYRRYRDRSWDVLDLLPARARGS